MVHVSLKEFILTGAFGPIRESISRRQLRSILGPPDEFGCLPQKESRYSYLADDGKWVTVPPRQKPNPNHAAVWWYGSFEFHFDGRSANDRVWMVFADNFRRLRGGSKLRLSAWKLRGGADRLAIQRELETLGVGYYVKKHACSDTEMRVLTDTGVELLFNEDSESNEPLGLWVISRHLTAVPSGWKSPKP